MEWKESQGMILGFPRKVLVVFELGEVKGWTVGKFEWNPARGCALGFCLQFWFGPEIGDGGGDSVGKCESDVLRPSYGVLVGWSLKVCRSVHPMGPG